MSVMLIRLAQSFSKITFSPDADPASKPPAAWAELGGRKSKEKVWLKSHLTMYMEVSGLAVAFVGGSFLIVLESSMDVGSR